MFEELAGQRFAAIYADPPWHFKAWPTDKLLADGSRTRAVQKHYQTMQIDEMSAMPVSGLCADDCCLFIWVCWPNLEDAFALVRAWGFEYKTCAFSWMKAHAGQIEMFQDDNAVQVGLGYWTRANSEVCLLATRGKPKRQNADVRQGIIEPRRQHSRKPSCVYNRIERLVSGPYLELFARTTHPGWASWGNQVGKFAESTI